MISNAKLDKCHGHFGPVEWEGKLTVMYHYHLNREYRKRGESREISKVWSGKREWQHTTHTFPPSPAHSVGCFRGEVDYYRALGSVQMRETNLPVYSRSPLAEKIKNERWEIDAAAAVSNKTATAVAGVDALLEAAAAKAEEAGAGV